MRFTILYIVKSTETYHSPERVRGVTKQAWIYIWAVLGVAALLSVVGFFASPIDGNDWLPFAGLVILACLAQLYESEAPGRQSYYPHIVFFFAGVLLLPPPLYVLLVIVPHLVEWAKERLARGPHLKAWYIQPFNIATHIIAGMVAYWVYKGVGVDPLTTYNLSSVAGVMVAAVSYVLINHVLVGMVLVLARGVSWKQSGVMERDSLVPDAVLSMLGYVVAVLVSLSPWLALPALAPLALINRVFMLLRLKNDDLTDPSTGLWNARHFSSTLRGELERARRFSRDLSLLVVELDTAKEVSDRYGKVALDRTIASMGKVLRGGTRQYDVCARIGSTRFAVLLPETNPFEALIVARRLRTAITEARVEVETAQEPIVITASTGLASFPGDAIDETGLVDAATRASQYAARRGRNSIACAADVPEDDREEGGLGATGEVFIPTSKKVTGFANPALRNPRSS